MWRIAFNAASRTTNIATGEDGPLEDHIQCAFVFPKWCGDGIKDDGTNGTQDKGEQCDNGISNGTAGNTCSATCQTVIAPTYACTSLTVTPPATLTNGGNVTLTCVGSGTITSYNIVVKKPDGSTLTTITTASGSATIPATPTGTYTASCFVNNQTATPLSCQTTIVNNASSNTVPNILIDKDDSTPGTVDTDGNDTQKVANNGTAIFTVRFTNNGNEALRNVIITDQYASDCNRSSTQTATLYGGGATANFDPRETFSYECMKTNVTSSTFPNNRNTASITGIGITS
jgi:uncharacterized repeat protein (TIGR01451 family)